MEHKLTIVSLHDAQLKCSCSWSLTHTGQLTKVQAVAEHDSHIYSEFRQEWRKTHSISAPPSFTSWKRNYKNK